MRRPVLSLLLLALLTCFLGLGRQAITDSDEAYYAEAAREMVEAGDWLTPHFNYEDRWQKPVLYYWLTAATYLVAGPTEWAARFWSAMSGIGLVMLTLAAARRMLGDDRAAWLAGAIVATCFGCFSEARLALPDLPLTFFITLGIWAALEASEGAGGHRLGLWALAGVAAGLGFLTKGPVALVIPGIVLLPIWVRERRRVSLPVSGVLVASILTVLVGVPWYVAMYREHGGAYLQSFFLGDNLERFATGRFNQRRELWYYLPIVLGGIMPWSAYLIAVAGRAVNRIRMRLPLTDVEWRLLIWAGMPLLFYTASVGQQPRYILPVLLPLAIAVGGSITRQLDAARSGAASRALASATWATAIMLAIIGFLFGETRAVFINALPGMSWVAVAACGASALLIGGIAIRRAWSALPLALTICSSAVLLSVQFGALAGRRPEAVEEMAALVRMHRRMDESVGTSEVFGRNLVFYTGVRQETLEPSTAAIFVQSADRVLLVVRERDLPAVEQMSGVDLHELGRVAYFNAANVRLRTFLRPDPLEEIDSVLLVTNR